jgi:CheY-like chemotaxis protein
MPANDLVLVAAVDPVARADVRATVEPLGARVIEAGDGATALRWLTNVRPELVVLDLVGADLDCFEACRRIKADPATAGVPVVVVCRDTQHPELRTCGCDAALADPADRGALLAAARRWLGGAAGPGAA